MKMKSALSTHVLLFLLGYYISAVKLLVMSVLLMALCISPTTSEREEREKIESENLGDIDNILI
jgi:hypothetical protein